jgi:(2Fe-2S) ferredoxin
MPKLANVDELMRAGAAAQREIDARRQAATTIYIGMGTCGIAAGARDTLHAIQDELARRGLDARVEGVGCIGFCVREPLVDIQLAGQPRVTYGNIGPDKVSRLIEEHIVKGAPVKQWVVGKLVDW